MRENKDRRFTAVAVALVLSLASVLSGCPGPTFVVQQYTGPQRDNASIAVLRVNASDAVRLVVLDDENLDVPLESDSRLHIEILPGRHTLSVRSAMSGERLEALVLEAEPGKVYRVTAAAAEARIFEVSRGSDALVRDVTAGKK